MKLGYFLVLFLLCLQASSAFSQGTCSVSGPLTAGDIVLMNCYSPGAANTHSGDYYLDTNVQRPTNSSSYSHSGLVHFVQNRSDDYLNLRSGPSLGSEVILRMPNGARLTEVAREGLWLHVQMITGITGWAYAGHMRASNEVSKTAHKLLDSDDLLEIHWSAWCRETEERCKALEFAIQLSVAFASDENEASKEYSTQAQEPLATASIVHAGQLWLVGNPEEKYLNLREGPGLNTPIVKRMTNGTRLLEQARQGLWVHVETQQGEIGWAYAGYLKQGRANLTSHSTSDEVVDEPDVEFTEARWQELRKLFQGPTSALPEYQLALSPIRDMIAEAEADEEYNSVVWSAKVAPPLLVSHHTIQELYNWRYANPGQNYAVGRYQFIHTTLKRVQIGLGVDVNSVFAPGLQDTFADYLLLERGLVPFLEGRLSIGEFQNRLAREWAGIPTTSGKSYYDKIAGNAATIPIIKVQRALEFARSRYRQHH